MKCIVDVMKQLKNRSPFLVVMVLLNVFFLMGQSQSRSRRAAIVRTIVVR